MGTERLQAAEEAIALWDVGQLSVQGLCDFMNGIASELVAEVRVRRAEPTDAQIREAVVAWLANRGKSAYDQMAAALVAAREATEDR